MSLALLSIGINYDGQLRGCIRDSINIMRYFSARRSLAASWQMIDSTAPTDPMYPSRANIERQLKTLSRQSGRYNQIIVHYSGHGSQTRDRSNDEPDRLDEVLVPADYQTAGFITDDWLLRNIVLVFPSSTQVLFIVDACHSGSVLDLRYAWNNLKRGGVARVLSNAQCTERPNVTLLSGCLDSQYSYETEDSTFGSSGALTSALLHTLLSRSTRDLLVIITYIQQKLTNQTAQLSCTRKTPNFALT
jgi:hypothetical protein